jgi:hypothetical protein
MIAETIKLKTNGEGGYSDKIVRNDPAVQGNIRLELLFPSGISTVGNATIASASGKQKFDFELYSHQPKEIDNIDLPAGHHEFELVGKTAPPVVNGIIEVLFEILP